MKTRLFLPHANRLLRPSILAVRNALPSPVAAITLPLLSTSTMLRHLHTSPLPSAPLTPTPAEKKDNEPSVTPDNSAPLKIESQSITGGPVDSVGASENVTIVPGNNNLDAWWGMGWKEGVGSFLGLAVPSFMYYILKKMHENLSIQDNETNKLLTAHRQFLNQLTSDINPLHLCDKTYLFNPPTLDELKENRRIQQNLKQQRTAVSERLEEIKRILDSLPLAFIFERIYKAMLYVYKSHFEGIQKRLKAEDQRLQWLEYMAKAREQHMLKNYDAALGHLTSAENLLKNNINAFVSGIATQNTHQKLYILLHNQRAKVQAANSDRIGSLQSYEAALAHDENNVSLHSNRGAVLIDMAIDAEKKKNYVKMIELVDVGVASHKKALNLDTQNLQIKTDYAWSLIVKLRVEKEYFPEKVINSEFIELQQYTENLLLDVLQSAKNQNQPLPRNTLLFLGIFYLNQNNPDKALLYLEAGNSQHPNLLRRKAEALEKLGRPVEAKEAREKAAYYLKEGKEKGIADYLHFLELLQIEEKKSVIPGVGGTVSDTGIPAPSEEGDQASKLQKNGLFNSQPPSVIQIPDPQVSSETQKGPSGPGL
jgi:tetratricopeptide (TPR) repeat protein